MRKLIVATLLLTTAVGYCAYTEHADRLEAEALSKRREEAIAIAHAEVRALAKRHAAKSDWLDSLSKGRSTRSDRVFTVELQDHWAVSGRPILFVGSLDDVLRADTGEYVITISHGGLQRPIFLRNDLRLMLRCEESTVRPLMAAARAGATFAEPLIAVVASIETIASSSKRDAEGDEFLVLTGHGRCAEAIALPRGYR